MLLVCTIFFPVEMYAAWMWGVLGRQGEMKRDAERESKERRGIEIKKRLRDMYGFVQAA